jgi:S-adenosylmethionine synthetase
MRSMAERTMPEHTDEAFMIGILEPVKKEVGEEIKEILVKAGVSDEILLQLGYAIGVSKPVSFYVSTCGKSNLKISDSRLSEIINDIFDLRPFEIESRFKLRDPIYFETSSYGHMGRKCIKKTKSFNSKYSDTKNIEVELFPWEKLDYIEQITKSLKL